MELQKKTLAITGAGGFIGLRMVQRAQDLGMEVRGLELSPENAERARQNGAKVIVGDICDSGAVKALCQGADILFHTAAIKKETGKWDLFYRVNVEGCHIVARAAREAQVKRFIHLSSVAV
ncbi:MAG: NAD-dependent epimerase/dehydratase family protein, partial [Deltaproteobacteria bacterium]|nr:NAD-dependent epimerase/dehydratase family protein [Deltaproteobacteria bacterium]